MAKYNYKERVENSQLSLLYLDNYDTDLEFGKEIIMTIR